MHWFLVFSLLLAEGGTARNACGEEKNFEVTAMLRPGRTPPLLIAHRGLSARYPENTLAAFRAAIEAGGEMLELDVGLSADGHVIVLHDDTLDRTTNGEGRLADSLIERLNMLDAGAWFDRSFAGERLPTLAEALDLARGRSAVNIEIKPEAAGSELRGGVEEKVVALVRERHMEEAVLVSSFAPFVVERIKRLAPNLSTALLYGRAVDFDPVELVTRVRADGLNMSRRHLTADLVRRLHASGRFLCVYTVDSPEELERVSALGVDGIFTNDIEAAAAALGRKDRSGAPGEGSRVESVEDNQVKYKISSSCRLLTKWLLSRICG